MEDKVFLGVNEKGLQVWVSNELILQLGEHEVRERLGLTGSWYPIATRIGKEPYPVMIRANSQEDAIQKYLNRKHKWNAIKQSTKY